MLLRKLKTAASLLARGKITVLARAFFRPFVRHSRHRIDCLELDSFVPLPFARSEEYDFKQATPEEMVRLFAEWPDSDEELIRHRQVYEEYGFQRCFLLIEKRTSEVVCLQFLLTFDDVLRGRPHLPWAVYRRFSSADSAWHQWIYTFSDHRGKGLAVAATGHLVQYCRSIGLRKLYSSRGITNQASVAMADKAGFRPIAYFHRFQFPWHKRSQGLHVIRRVHGSSLPS